jgi:hypothetical protein
MQFIVGLLYLTGLEKLGFAIAEHSDHVVQLLYGISAAVLDDERIRPHRTFSGVNLARHGMELPGVEVETEERLDAPVFAVPRVAVDVPHQSLGPLGPEKGPLIHIAAVRILGFHGEIGKVWQFYKLWVGFVICHI